MFPFKFSPATSCHENEFGPLELGRRIGLNTKALTTELNSVLSMVVGERAKFLQTDKRLLSIGFVVAGAVVANMTAANSID